MTQKKKLQVFISSTYTDLKEERQAAVEAVLTAGHIPAGMELFAAGDESQMNVIKRWIDESDVYMLILGGRYGSIEPKSQKSYIQLEYEYAVERNKPLFAVVIDESYLEKKAKKDGLKAIEKDHSERLKDFKQLVCSKMVRFWKDPKDIKLAILETMADFSKREELIGWIPGDEAINSGAVAEEMAKLVKENNDLRERISKSSNSSAIYSGLTFEEMYNLLESCVIKEDDLTEAGMRLTVIMRFNEFTSFLGEARPTMLHYYWLFKERFRDGRMSSTTVNKINKQLNDFGLIEIGDGTGWLLSEAGKQFLIRLRLEDKFREADKYAF